MSESEVKELIKDASDKFNKDVNPLISIGLYENARYDLEIILNILRPNEELIKTLPAGINYLISVCKIYNSLNSNKKPSEKIMQDYCAYAAQVQMRIVE
ncbi:hypothetical protein COV13_01585 [Candidatus Woesearchaeota archaeon CG10_big_fil_rev_8_21_14_0_10_32_9]|nr:MAG: hypothetical protein COV13_01585 [Candidatus Woesearchaeota archaeon CG10_big_fil_rev_8_21_14_0_10_32_9]